MVRETRRPTLIKSLILPVNGLPAKISRIQLENEPFNYFGLILKLSHDFA
jgi:hypothetical protein